MIERIRYPLSFIEKILVIILKPKEFFSIIKEEGSVKKAIYYYLILFLATLPLALFMNFLITPELDTFTAIINLVVYFAVSSGLVFFNIVMLHLFTYLVGGREGILRTAQAILYGATPTLLTSWYPFVNIIGGLYTAVLIVLGIRDLHNISTFRAVLVYLLPFLITLLLLALGLIYLFFIITR